MKVQIKTLSHSAVIPKYSQSGDAGLDLTATSKELTEGYVEYGTSISIAIPEGYVGLLFPRSSISKIDLVLANSVGVIDSNYRGEVKLRFKKTTPLRGSEYNVGDRVGQLIILPYPEINFEQVAELNDTERGEGGFGSTGA